MYGSDHKTFGIDNTVGAAGEKKGKKTKEEKKNQRKRNLIACSGPQGGSDRTQSRMVFFPGPSLYQLPVPIPGQVWDVRLAGWLAGWPPKYLVIVLAPRNTPVSLACDSATCARSRARLDHPPESSPRRGTPAMLCLAWSPGRTLLLRAQRPHIQTENRRALSHPAPHAAIRGSRLFHRIASCTAAYPCATIQFPKKI